MNEDFFKTCGLSEQELFSPVAHSDTESERRPPVLLLEERLPGVLP